MILFFNPDVVKSPQNLTLLLVTQCQKKVLVFCYSYFSLVRSGVFNHSSVSVMDRFFHTSI